MREGETVVDLGSGGGLDVLLAAHKVGPTGKAIGIDMTPGDDRRWRVRTPRSQGSRTSSTTWRRSTRLPLAGWRRSDCVISNCVINLAPDKPAVFREIARVLKPGGRLAVSDIALKRELPAEIGQDIMAYVGCIAGAILIDDYRRMLLEAGFAHVEIIDSGRDLNAYAKVENQAGCCSPAPRSADLPIAGSGCCSSAGAQSEPHGTSLHSRLAELLTPLRCQRLCSQRESLRREAQVIRGAGTNDRGTAGLARS